MQVASNSLCDLGEPPAPLWAWVPSSVRHKSLEKEKASRKQVNKVGQSRGKGRERGGHSTEGRPEKVGGGEAENVRVRGHNRTPQWWPGPPAPLSPPLSLPPPGPP